MCPMIHSSIIIVYTYIWYFDYYYTGHGVLNANRPAINANH